MVRNSRRRLGDEVCMPRRHSGLVSPEAADVSSYSDEFGGQVLNATVSLFTHCHIAEAEDTEAEFRGGRPCREGSGSLGLKVSGAGGGGFMIVAVEPPQRYAVFRALERLGGAVFSFSFVDRGVESWNTESVARDAHVGLQSGVAFPALPMRSAY